MRLDRLSGPLMTLLALCFCPPPPARAVLIPRSGDLLLASEGHELLLGCPTVAVGVDGAAMTVWTRNSAPAYLRGPVLSRRVEIDGTMGPEVQLSEDDELAFLPEIVALEDGYVVHWTRDSFPGGPLGGTVVRFLDASGNPVDAARVVDESLDARVAAVGDRLALVTSHGLDLRLRLIDRRGADVYAPRQVATTTSEADNVYTYELASDGEGGVVIAWLTGGWPGLDLKVQAFDAAGQPRSGPIVVARRLAAMSLQVAAGGGRFVVGWSEQRPNGVELRVFSLAGERLDAPRLPRATGVRPLRIRLLTDLEATPQGVMVVWSSMNRLGGFEDLFAAGFEWDWERTTRSTSLSADRRGEQLCGRVSTNGGDWAAAWKEVSQDPSALFVHNEARMFSGL